LYFSYISKKNHYIVYYISTNLTSFTPYRLVFVFTAPCSSSSLMYLLTPLLEMFALLAISLIHKNLSPRLCAALNTFLIFDILSSFIFCFGTLSHFSTGFPNGEFACKLNSAFFHHCGNTISINH